MDIVPVKGYKEPKYPNKGEVRDNRRLLEAVPERWKNNLYIGTALSTLITLTMTSCAHKNTKNHGGNEAAGIVAPIFEHGTGRGSFGCQSIAPPAFLSEEEAYQVIQEEIKVYGITFNKNNFKISEKELDGYDSDKKIGYEFMSTQDHEELIKPEYISSVVDYDFQKAANIFSEEIKEENEGTTVGIFYNPMVEFSEELLKKLNEKENWEDREEMVKNMAKEDLRKQVRDFLEWLKGQEII